MEPSSPSVRRMPVLVALLVVIGMFGAAPPASAGVLECGELLECLRIEEPCTDTECLPDPCEEVSCGCEDGEECEGGETAFREALCQGLECAPDPCHYVNCDCLYDGDCTEGEVPYIESVCEDLGCAPDPCETANCDPEPPCVDEECPRFCNTQTGCLLPGTVCGYLDLVPVNPPEDCTEQVCWLEALLDEEVVYTGDMDGDGVDDCHDPDVDGDGIGNAVEEAIGWTVRNADTDGDGLPDARDPTPDAADVPVKIVVRAFELRLYENPLFDDACTWGDPYLRDAAGVTLAESGRPQREQVLKIDGLTEDDHHHNTDRVDLTTAGEPATDTVETLSNDLQAYPKKEAFPGIAAIYLELPLADHDVAKNMVDDTCKDWTFDGHPRDEWDDHDELMVAQNTDFWSLLELVQSPTKTIPSAQLERQGLTALTIAYGDPPEAELVIEVGTNVPACALYVNKLAQDLSSTIDDRGNDFIDLQVLRREQRSQGTTCA